jgi:pre-mRNA-splicing factor SYF1
MTALTLASLQARDIFEEGIKKVLTIRDFTTVFDAYAEFSESFISGMMDQVASGEADADDEAELDKQMQAFEALMDRRPFLVNEVLLRRNPNDVQEWEKRVVLFGSDDDKVDDTYQMATATVNPRKAVGALHQLYLSWAKFFELGGVLQEAEPDLPSARKVFEKAVQVPFKKVDDLATVWCEWAQMEVRAENFDEALRVLSRATAVPRKTNISFHDENLTSQARLFKSLKLWSFRADLEESLGTVESTKAVYDKIFELKIANAQMVVNFANFLEENDYFEESFKVYERGLELFTYPIRFELLNAYLAKFLARYKDGSKIERARDLFEDAVAHVPPKFAKNLFLMYAKMEEDYGLAKRAMKVYDRAIDKVAKADQFEVRCPASNLTWLTIRQAFEVLIARTATNFGLPATRPVYQRALETLPDAETAEMCIRFAALERKLGEIDRARSIYAHGSQFCDPRINPDYWATWHSFELDTGSEDTFREYLRSASVLLCLLLGLTRVQSSEVCKRASIPKAHTYAPRQRPKKRPRRSQTRLKMLWRHSRVHKLAAPSHSSLRALFHEAPGTRLTAATEHKTEPQWLDPQQLGMWKHQRRKPMRTRFK